MKVSGWSAAGVSQGREDLNMECSCLVLAARAAALPWQLPAAENSWADHPLIAKLN